MLGGDDALLSAPATSSTATLDSEVDRVQRDLDRSFEDVRRSVREELDRRLPADPTP